MPPTWYPEAVNSLSRVLAWRLVAEGWETVPEAPARVHVYVGQGAAVFRRVDETEIVRAWLTFAEISSNITSVIRFASQMLTCTVSCRVDSVTHAAKIGLGSEGATLLTNVGTRLGEAVLMLSKASPTSPSLSVF